MGRLKAATAAANIVMMAVSLFTDDQYWIVMGIVCIVAMYLPEVYRLDCDYTPGIVVWALVPTVLGIAIALFSDYSDFLDAEYLYLPVGTHLLTSMMVVQGYFSGLMIMLALDRSGRISLTKRWMYLMAMMFVLALAVGFMFYDFIRLYAEGYPVFNHSPGGREGLMRSNGILLGFTFLGSFEGLALMMASIRSFRGRPKESLMPSEAEQ